MKLKEFIDNPVGKGDSSLNRAALTSMLDSKYDNLIKNKGDKIKHNIYHQMNTDNYFIHLEIPTETDRDNTYDVVLYFFSKEKTNSPSLLNSHDVQFFCNAPSFAYTFAKVYDTQGLLVQPLRNKFPSEIYASNPDTRNRYGIVNYDKYLYFGCKYVLESRLLNRGTLGLRSINYSKLILDQRVRNLDRIMIDYKKAEKKLKKDRTDHVKDIVQKVTKKAKSINSVNPGVHEKTKKKPISNTINKKTKINKITKR